MILEMGFGNMLDVMKKSGDNRMRKIMVYAEFPAPYRVAGFEVLSKYDDLEVYYECIVTEERSRQYAVQNSSFPYYFLNDKCGKQRFRQKTKQLRDFDFILIYNACWRSGIYLSLVSILQRVPYFVNNDGGFVGKKNIKDLVKHFIFGHASLCFASGVVSANYFHAYGVPVSKIRFHNFTSLSEEDILKKPVSYEDKYYFREKTEAPKNKICFITVGQFVPRKGFDLLLRAWKLLDNDRCHLLMIGGGSQRKNYENYIETNRLQNVTLLDFLPKERLFEYYKASDVFVFPTREDVWGLVINEAMACGLPVISSNMCLAAKELVENGVNGFLYEMQDVQGLSRKMEEISGDSDLRKVMAANNIKKMQGSTMAAIGEKHHTDIEAFFNEK